MPETNDSNEEIGNLLNSDEKVHIIKRKYLYSSELDFKYLIEASLFLTANYGVEEGHILNFSN